VKRRKGKKKERRDRRSGIGALFSLGRRKGGRGEKGRWGRQEWVKRGVHVSPVFSPDTKEGRGEKGKGKIQRGKEKKKKPRTTHHYCMYGSEE